MKVSLRAISAFTVVLLCGIGWLLATADSPNLDVRLSPPSLAHWAGTDHLGRDVLTRTLRALAQAAAVAVPAWIIAVGIGALIGMIAAVRDREPVARMIDWSIRIAFSTPFLLVLVGLGAVVGRGMGAIFLVVVLLAWAPPARHARAIARDVLGAPYTQAALTLGFSPFDLARYVLAPACLRPVLAASGGLLVEILALDMALTLFGFGSPPPSPTLGTLLADGLRYFSSAPWMALVPLAVLCCLCVGLRTLVGPRPE